jgi:hypothetical protein
MAAMATLLGGCVVADPPDYGRTDQTPPLLLLGLADPNVHEVLHKKKGESVPFKVPVRSEDAGDDLFAQLFLNYKLEGEDNPRFTRVRASTFDDQEREVRITWNVPARQGCQQLSLVVTHFSNLDEGNLPIRAADTAIATWWINIDDVDDPVLDPENASWMGKCPKAAAPTN